MCTSCSEKARAYQARPLFSVKSETGLKSSFSTEGKYSLQELKEKLSELTSEDSEYPIVRSAISVYKTNPNIYNDLLDPIMGFEQ